MRLEITTATHQLTLRGVTIFGDRAIRRKGKPQMAARIISIARGFGMNRMVFPIKGLVFGFSQHVVLGIIAALCDLSVGFFRVEAITRVIVTVTPDLIALGNLA